MSEQRAGEELPIACALTPTELQSRRAKLVAELTKIAEGSEATTVGYRFRFSASSEALAKIVAVIDAERQCCRFLRFQLTVEPDLGPLRLEVTGPPGTGEFLTDLLQP
jgi:hypothetical protein